LYCICLICSICLQVPTALPFVSPKFPTYLSSIHVLTQLAHSHLLTSIESCMLPT
jgi:hypothetical protein